MLPQISQAAAMQCEAARQLSTRRASQNGQKQWDGLLLNLNGIAMCQTEEAYFSVTGREGVRYEA